jgi:hypothetical protein
VNKKPTPLVDEHLKSVQGLEEAPMDDFFYTRLKARMEKATGQPTKILLKSVWLIGTLVLLLAMNGLMLTKQLEAKKTNTTAPNSLQSFAASYDQTVSTAY